MEADQPNRPPALPAKLRWRPYANGTSKKNSTKLKKIQAPPNPKAAAHKVRGQQYYSGKTTNAPVEIKLQWEEAETIQSMSHGGHPQNHSHPLSGASDRSRGSSPSSASDASSSADGDNVHSNAMRRAMISLPSPPLSSLQNSTTRLDLVGGQSDLNLFNASLPDLTRNCLDQNTVFSLSDLASDSAYQIALTALLQGDTFRTNSGVFQNTKLDASANTNGHIAAASSTNSATVAALLGSSTVNDILLSTPDRVLSNDQVLGVSTIDELLTSCGMIDSDSSTNNILNQTVQMLASPSNTDQSFNSSPSSGLFDLTSTGSSFSRATSPSSTGSFSPMAINSQAFEALLAQPAVSQPSTMIITGGKFIGSDDPYNALLQELASPFGYLSTDSNTPAKSAPTAWPSLFPVSTEDQTLVAAQSEKTPPQPTPQRSEMATQTDGPYEPLSPLSTRTSTSHQGSPLSSLGITEQELDPDWLSFLDEGSPLFNELEAEEIGKTNSIDDNNRPGDTTTTQRDKVMWSWAEQLLKPGATTPTVSRNGFPGHTVPSSIPSGTIGNGGLVRTLQGAGQQKGTKSSSSAEKTTASDVVEKQDANSKPKDGTATTNTSATTKVEKTQERSPAKSTEKRIRNDEGATDKQEEGFGGIVSMIKSLWISSGEDEDEKKKK